MNISNEDVAALGALESRTRDFAAHLIAATPALERLAQAGFPGVGYILGIAANLESDQLLEALTVAREANGDQAAYDYLWLVRSQGLSVDTAALELVEMVGTQKPALMRVVAFREYAASVA